MGAAPPPSRLRRVLRTMARVLLWTAPVLVALVALVGGAAFVWLRTDAGNAWLLGQVLSRIQPTAGAIEADGLRTDLLHHLTLTGVRVRAPDGAALVTVAEADAAVDTLGLLGLELPVDTLTLTGVVVDLPEPGVFGTMWPGDPSTPSEPWGGLPFAISARAVHVDGRVAIVGHAVEAITLDAGLTIRGNEVAWTGLTGTATTEAGPLSLGGAGAWTPAALVLQDTAVSVGDEHANRVTLSGVLTGDKLAFDLPLVHFDKDGLTALVPDLEKLPLAAPVDATGRVDGTIAAPRVAVTLTTAGGPLTVEGDVTPATRVWNARVTTPGFDTTSALVGVEPATLSGTVDAHGAGWTWPDALTVDATVDVAVSARGERITAKGPVHVEGGRITVDGLDAGAGWATARVSGEVDVPASAAHLQVLASRAQLNRFGVRGHAGYVGTVEADWADGVTVQGRGAITGGDLEAGGAKIARVAGVVDAGWDGKRPTGHATLDAADVTWKDRHAATGTVTATLGDTLGFTVSLAEPDRPIVELAGAYVLKTRALSLTQANVEVAPGLVVRNLGDQSVTLVDGGVRDAQLSFGLDDARLDVRGGVSTHGRDSLVVDLVGFDVATLDKVAPGKFPGWSGSVTAHVGLDGTLDDPTIQGVVQLAALTIPGQVRGLAGEVVVDADGRSMKIDATVGDGKRTLATLVGTLPVTIGKDGVYLAKTGALDARLAVAPLDTATLSELLEGRELPDARVSVELRASGSVGAPALVLVASANLPLSTGGPTVRVWLDGALTDGVVTTRMVLNQAFSPRLEADLAAKLDVPGIEAWMAGNGPAPDKHTVLKEFGGAVMLMQLPVATIRRFAPFPGDVDGALVGAFGVSGSIFAPRLEGGINVVSARVGRLAVAPATVSLTPLPIGYKLDANLGFTALPVTEGGAAVAVTCAAKKGDPAGAVRITGFVPLTDDFSLDHKGLDLKVGGAGVPLAAAEAFSTSLVDTAGCFHLDGTVTGTLKAPEVNVGFRLSDGASTVPPLGIRLEKISVNGRLQENRLSVDNLDVRTIAAKTLIGGGGDLHATGSVTLDNWAPKEVSAKAELDGVWLTATTDRIARVTGNLKLAGTAPVLDATGSLTLDEGFIRLDERFFSGERSTALHPDIEVVRPGAKAVVAESSGPSALSFDIRPNLTVNLARHARLSVAMPLQGSYGDLARALSTITVEAEADGVLTLSKRSGQFSLKGEVTTTRGSAVVIGRPFDITEGTLAFTGTDIKAPILDLHATHHADCGDIQVAISGLPGSPALDFSSDVLPDQDAILRALVLGTCVDSGSGTAQSDALTQTLGLLTQALTKEAVSRGSAGAQGLLRLDKLEVDPSGTTRVGVTLGRNLFLTTEFNPAPATPQSNQFTLRAEFALPYQWFLGVESGDRGATSISAYWKYRF